MDLQQKVMDAFIGKVVRKDLAFLVKGGLPVPTYVLEYLLGQYCASDDEEIINEGLEKVKQVIQNNYVHRAEAESVKGIIREHGKHRIIDKVTVVLNEKNDEYQATFANLGLSGIPIGTDYVRKNPKLLSGNGVWCIVTIGYISGEDVKVRWEIQTLKPIQISNIDLQEYIEQRQKFTTEEWIDFLMHTVGLNPETMNRREKFITLARLLPHVENNFNFMELGPKGTGKSHVFQELSPYGVLVSGGDVTSARLFVKMSGKREELGLVGYWDVVAWDEFEQQKGRSVDAVLIDTMQNYLANKSFNRGKGTHEASASMVFVGNTKHTVPYMLKNTHLFESIPTSFIKGAFLDRIHLYNPGWEIKMLKKDSFSKGYGLITDYIAAVLHAMRNDDRTAILKEYAKFDGSLSERDHLAIRKNMYGKAEELLGLLDKDVERLSRSIPENQVSFYHFLAEYQTCFILAHEFSHIHYYIDKQGLEQNLPSMKESLIWLRNQLNTGKPLLARLIHFLVPRMRRLQEHSFDEAIEKPELQEELLCDDAAWRITNYLIKTNIPDAEVRAVLSAFVVFTTYYIETQRTLENIYMTADNNLRQQHLMFDTTRSTVLVHTAWDDVEPAAIRHYKSLVNNLCRAGRVRLMLSLRSNVEHIAYLRLMPKEKYSLQEVKRLDTMFGEVDAKVRRRERQSE